MLIEMRFNQPHIRQIMVFLNALQQHVGQNIRILQKRNLPNLSIAWKHGQRRKDDFDLLVRRHRPNMPIDGRGGFRRPVRLAAC